MTNMDRSNDVISIKVGVSKSLELENAVMEINITHVI